MASATKRKRKKPGKMPRFSISFPPTTQEELNHLADKKKVSVAWIVRDAVDR